MLRLCLRVRDVRKVGRNCGRRDRERSNTRLFMFSRAIVIGAVSC